MTRPHRSNPVTMQLARNLRKELTLAEKKLWFRLRNDQLGVSFRKQHAIGNYIADFCCVKHKLIVELDGSQHKGQRAYDKERTIYFQSMGYTVIRFLNSRVMNDINSIIREIQETL